ncbi:hypothetical protein AUR64_03970 [Haloprofundus marisrubri]|uniref:Uncharacterized protein n=1 Tax=Haloprofundus marisrubri TaxID=1514971 RepID=A0A0W1RDA8_9EURY|nr:hypothetical protein AUR64_03970 [Haloprofundus marisrubri]
MVAVTFQISDAIYIVVKFAFVKSLSYLIILSYNPTPQAFCIASSGDRAIISIKSTEILIIWIDDDFVLYRSVI